MDHPDAFKILEFVFIHAAILGLLVWQLWSVRKSIRDDKKRDAALDAPPRHPDGQ
jgi:hypothetical protein